MQIRTKTFDISKTVTPLVLYLLIYLNDIAVEMCKKKSIYTNHSCFITSLPSICFKKPVSGCFCDVHRALQQQQQQQVHTGKPAFNRLLRNARVGCVVWFVCVVCLCEFYLFHLESPRVRHCAGHQRYAKSFYGKLSSGAFRVT